MIIEYHPHDENARLNSPFKNVLNESGFYYKINNNQRQQRADTVVFRKNIVA